MLESSINATGGTSGSMACVRFVRERARSWLDVTLRNLRGKRVALTRVDDRARLAALRFRRIEKRDAGSAAGMKIHVLLLKFLGYRAAIEPFDRIGIMIQSPLRHFETSLRLIPTGEKAVVRRLARDVQTQVPDVEVSRARHVRHRERDVVDPYSLQGARRGLTSPRPS